VRKLRKVILIFKEFSRTGSDFLIHITGFSKSFCLSLFYYPEGTSKKMLESDPDFAMGHIFTLGMEAFGKSKK
jgi:hypothetical protein